VKDLLKKQSMPEDHKELIMDFLSKILEVSPEKRISVDEALKHGIFSMNYPKTIYIRQKNL
jgi:serine/threonine protein kinase